MILKSKDPKCLFMFPSTNPENEIDLLNDDWYLKYLKKVDGMTVAQFKDMVKNPEA